MNKVYVVMKGYDYEGYTDWEMEVFTNKVDAEAYAQSIKTEYVDYVSVFERVLK